MLHECNSTTGVSLQTGVPCRCWLTLSIPLYTGPTHIHVYPPSPHRHRHLTNPLRRSAIACRSFSPKGIVSRVVQRVTVAVPLHMAGYNVDDFGHLVFESELVGDEPVPRMAAVCLRNGV
jgi:hypothetical protein